MAAPRTHRSLSLSSELMLVAQQKLPENGVVSYAATVERGWLDYNEHMNVAYYVMAFDGA